MRIGPHFLQREGRSFLPVGAHFVPVEGPDWPWRVGWEAFDRGFAQMAEAGMNAARIDLLWAAIEPEPGRYDEPHLKQLDEILAAARHRGLWLHPAMFIGGEVGDAYWDVPWREGRHPHRDPEMLRLQARHAAMLAKRWRGDPSIVAWDLTDEPPFWLFGEETTDDDAREWTRTLAEAIRAENPESLITIGTSGQEVEAGPFRADVIAEQLDFACVHPYPIYQEDVYPDALLAPRMTHAAAFETALAAGAGRPVMVHEYGASSAQFDPEEIAAYDRLLTWSSFGRGAIGYFAWCWTDAQPEAFRRAPYVRQPHETQFGVTDWQGNLRPRGHVLSEFATITRQFALDAIAANGPAPEPAAILVPHEYVRRFDPEAYGLDAGSAGPYHPSESAWSPRKGGADALPLVRAWLNAFVLAARAGLCVSFPRESLDDTWPDVGLLLLPAPLASTTHSLWHVRTSFWRGADRFLAGGGMLYLSCSSDVAIPEMEAVAACRLADRRRTDRPAVLRFVAPWGPFRSGDELELPDWDRTIATRGVRLRPAGAEPVALDANGDPALVVAERGAGRVVTCSFPVELLLAGVPDAHGPEDRTWGIYAGLRELADAAGPAGIDHPDVTTGSLFGPRGGLLAVTNHGPAHLDVDLRVPSAGARLIGLDGPGPLDGGLSLDPYGSAIVAWEASLSP